MIMTHQKYLTKVASKLKLDPDETVGMMTAANIHDYSIITKSLQGLRVTTVMTAGLSNPASAGGRCHSSTNEAGTINSITIANSRLSEGCMVNAVQTVVEAKVMALKELDIRCLSSKKLASGTVTDSVIIASQKSGPLYKYAGTATKLGELIGKTVKLAVQGVIQKGCGVFSHRPLVKRMEEYGVYLKDLIDSCLELFVYHSSMGKKSKVRKVLEEEFQKALTDINVAALLISGFRLEEDGVSGLIPGLESERYLQDPVNLIADELLGMAIANYIAGSWGIFEYVRFDQKKPGVLRDLGPFLDDAIGGLIAGVSSKTYSRLIPKE